MSMSLAAVRARIFTLAVQAIKIAPLGTGRYDENSEKVLQSAVVTCKLMSVSLVATVQLHY